MNGDDPFGEDDDEMDDLLVSVLEDTTGILSSSTVNISCGGGRSITEPVLVDGFDRDSGRTWIYPTNKQVRDYQYNIVMKSLVANTLVCLPTGLGKTFIAAVVMYNFYRWFPRGKIIFMAPTKPLVAQQIEACFEVMGIPQTDMAEMTGSMTPKNRTVSWNEKRVFFLTPQVISNDISRGICPVTSVKCVVVDEAHKALGNHAYVQVVRELHNNGGIFRVLALSATPGSDSQQVQQVITNLLIANIEVRTDESIDIVPYIHHRKIDKVVVELDDELIEMRARYLEVINVYIERLHHYKVISTRNLETLSKYQLLKDRDRFRSRPPSDLPRMQWGAIEGYFAVSMSLYHGLELLQFYGMHSFYVFWNETLNSPKKTFKSRFELQRNVTFFRILDNLERRFNRKVLDAPSTSTSNPSTVVIYSHPKYKKLEELVLNHFKATANEIEDTRVIIFAQYRESVKEIETVLNRHRPTLRPLVLIGQSSVRGGTKGLNQKLQVDVMDKFRSGTSNILVATCVGEEGLDIGDVDLIICFDAQQSPVRLIQRMGRTGRKRDGRVVVLMTKGKEEGQYARGQFNKRAFNRAMTGAGASYQMFLLNPRMIPKDIEPVCHKMFLSAGVFVHKEKSNKTSVVETAGRKTINPYLNDNQLKEWKSKYYLASNETVSIDFSPQMVSFLSKTEKESSKKQLQLSKGPTLSLTEWLPWQDTLNATFLVDHTKQTELFVDTMKFLEISSCCVETDEATKDSESNNHQTKKRKLKNNDGFGLIRNEEVLREEIQELRPDLGSEIAKESEDLEIVYDYNTSVQQECLLEKKEKQQVDSDTSFFGVFQNVNDNVCVPGEFIECVSIRTPPTSPPIAASCIIDYLDAIELVELSDDDDIMNESPVVLTKVSVCNEKTTEIRSPFKTPHPIGAVRKVVGRDSPLSSVPSTSRASIDLLKPCDVSVKSFEESLYSMSQLLGMIDYSTIQTPGNLQKSSIVSHSHPVAENQKEDPIEIDSDWDSNDDLFESCDIIPPTPEKLKEEIGSFSRHSVDFVGECSTSTPVAATAATAARFRLLASSASEDESLRTNARNFIRQKRPRRLDLSSSDSESSFNFEEQKQKCPRVEGRKFLLEEAEVSSEYAASCDETVSGDSYEGSFVDDRQDTDYETNSTMYLRSVKSPRAKPGAFKLLTRGVVNADIYSQTQISEDSDYLEDSFCVDNDSDEKTPPKRQRTVTNDDSSSDETMIVSPDVMTQSSAASSKNATASSKNANPLPSPVTTSLMTDTLQSKLPVAVCSKAVAQIAKIIIIVDSREVSGCQTIISDLRLKHKAHVTVSSLRSCDYIVSNRFAVERKLVSDIGNGALRKKLIERIEDMSENYLRTCLIVEKDRTKPKEQPRPHSITKYVAGMLVRLSSVVSRIIFTKSQEHTAAILFDLANSEVCSGYGIEAKHIEQEDDPMFNFYRKLLENNFIAAANFSTKFPSLKDFLKCSPEEISQCGFLPVCKAERIHQIVKQTF